MDVEVHGWMHGWVHGRVHGWVHGHRFLAVFALWDKAEITENPDSCRGGAGQFFTYRKSLLRRPGPDRSKGAYVNSGKRPPHSL